jgi:uncharacterized protein (DUF2267 family)
MDDIDDDSDDDDILDFTISPALVLFTQRHYPKSTTNALEKTNTRSRRAFSLGEVHAGIAPELVSYLKAHPKAGSRDAICLPLVEKESAKEVLPAEEMSILEPAFPQHIKTMTFDTAKHTTPQLKYLFEWCFRELGLMTRFKIPVDATRNFISEVARNYSTDNQYHNFHHAFDVFQMAFHLISTGQFDQVLDSLDVLSLLLATICHDMGHTGTNNAFHVKTKSPLAIMYNDRSVLENHHAARTFQILMTPGCNILSNLSEQDFSKVRENVIECILATDMAYHGKYLDDFKQSFAPCADFGDFGKSSPIPQASKILLLQVLTKACDISNVTRPFNIAAGFSRKVSEEFFEQGDIEQSLGMEPAPIFNRRMSQGKELKIAHGFMSFLAEPFFIAVADRIPAVKPLIENLQFNKSVFGSTPEEKTETVTQM